MRPACHIALLVVALATAPPEAAAQVVDLPEAHLETTPEETALLGTGIATVVQTEELEGTGESLADAVESVPGVQLRRFGAPGSYTAVGLRGLGPENVAVVLDELPLSAATMGPLDLSLYPVESVERVEVYRGGGPMRFAGPLGGVLRLVTRAPRDRTLLSAHAGYGSQHRRTAHAAAAGPWRWAGLGYSAYAGYEGSDGDYTFYDDRETLYTADDDRVARHTNNAHDVLVLRLGVERPLPLGAMLRLQANGASRSQGVPRRGGELTAAELQERMARYGSTERTHARQLEGTARAGITGLTFWDGRARLGGGTDVLASERTFRDPLRETGLGLDWEDSRVLQAGVDARLELLESIRHETELATRASWDQLTDAGPFAPRTLVRSRLTLGAGLEHRADLTPSLRVVPALRVDAARDSDRDSGDDAWIAGASPRLGLLWVLGLVELRANAAWFFRLPTLLERYGDAVFTDASPDLDPERGLAADLGASCRLRPPLLTGLDLEVAGFATEARQLIVLVPNSQFRQRATNVGKSRIFGVESRARARAPWVALDLAYTLTEARDTSGRLGYDGKRTPGVARHRLDAGLQLGPAWAHLRYELALASTTFLDRANLRPVPWRTLHHLHAVVRLWDSGFETHASVYNLLDTMAEDVPVRGAEGGTGTSALMDYLGFPLPGRTWFASLLWRQS